MQKFIHRILFTSAKFVVVTAIFIAIITIFAHSILVARPTQQLDMAKVYNSQAEEIFKQAEKGNPQQKLMMSAYRYMGCNMVGQGCTNSQNSFSNSLLGKMTSVISYTYTNPPASGLIETYNTFASSGLVPRTYAAQGLGFSSISGFRQIWIVFRNIAFGVLVLVMVAISFMIMFRMKLNAQTAISIESALPRIVFSLLLITFSYSIAGFLIDLMYVVMGVSITFLCSNDTYCKSTETVARYMNAGAGTIFTSFFPYDPNDVNKTTGFLNIILGILPGFDSDPNNPITAAISNMWYLSNSILTILPPTLMGLLYILGAAANVSIAGTLMAINQNSNLTSILTNIQAFTFSLGEAPQSIVGGILLWAIFVIGSLVTVPLLMMLFIFMTIIFLFFRIFFMLLTSYTQILLYIVFAPMFMLLEAIPGQNGFSNWFRNLLGELITFPLVAILFVVGSIIVNNFGNATNAAAGHGTVWQPPFLAGMEQKAFLMVIGMGILFMIPDLVKMVKDFLGVKGTGINFGLGSFFAGAGLGFGGAMGLVGKGGQLTNFLYGSGAAKEGKGIYGYMNKYKDYITNDVFRARSKASPAAEGFDRVKEMGMNMKRREIDKFMEDTRQRMMKKDPTLSDADKAQWKKWSSLSSRKADIEQFGQKKVDDYVEQKRIEAEMEQQAEAARHALAQNANATNQTVNQFQKMVSTSTPTNPPSSGSSSGSGGSQSSGSGGSSGGTGTP